MTDFETIEADDLGRRLEGFGVGLLCPDTMSYVPQLARVLELTVIRLDAFYGLLSWKASPDINSLIQVHADSTYAANPYYTMLGENAVRGVGLELRLFDCDPDAAVSRAGKEVDYTVLQPATDKPHGIREAFILDPLGYCWVPSIPISIQAGIPADIPG